VGRVDIGAYPLVERAPYIEGYWWLYPRIRWIGLNGPWVSKATPCQDLDGGRRFDSRPLHVDTAALDRDYHPGNVFAGSNFSSA